MKRIWILAAFVAVSLSAGIPAFIESPVAPATQEQSYRLPALPFALVETAYADEAAKPAEPAAAAAVAAAPSEPVPPSADELKEFFKGIGGLKGASALAIALFLVQGLALLFRSQLGKFAGVWRLVIISFATWAAGLIGLKIAGLDWFSAALHPATVAALGTWVNQLIKQIGKKKEDEAALAKA